MLAVVNGYGGDDAVLKTARAAAVRFGAHIDVLHVRADPYMPPYLDAAVAPSVTASLLAAMEAQVETRRNMAFDTFKRWREAASLSEAEPPAADSARPTVRWIERKGDERAIAAQGRFADLIVLSQPSREQENVTTAFLAGAFESALFGAARPVLVVPESYDGVTFVKMPVAVAWNGSLEADRAIGAALPFLASAGAATVIVGEEQGRSRPDVAGLAAYLERHGIAARLVEVRAERGALPAQILTAAQDAGAGLLVMGAYTHSRLREFVLGGVTNHVSTHARIPVLMAH
jgi:nucleotide-binding universal stress UspA family protein